MNSAKSPPSRRAEQFVLRLPPGMRDRLAAEAKRNGRSMNSELVDRLVRSLEGGGLDGAAGEPVAFPPAPPDASLGGPLRHGAEAGRPGLVVHRKPFPTPKL